MRVPSCKTESYVMHGKKLNVFLCGQLSEDAATESHQFSHVGSLLSHTIVAAVVAPYIGFRQRASNAKSEKAHIGNVVPKGVNSKRERNSI